jgi:hypothetical protein
MIIATVIILLQFALSDFLDIGQVF